MMRRIFAGCSAEEKRKICEHGSTIFKTGEHTALEHPAEMTETHEMVKIGGVE